MTIEKKIKISQTFLITRLGQMQVFMKEYDWENKIAVKDNIITSNPRCDAILRMADLCYDLDDLDDLIFKVNDIIRVTIELISHEKRQN